MTDLSTLTVRDMMDELMKRRGLQFVCIWRHRGEDTKGTYASHIAASDTIEAIGLAQDLIAHHQASVTRSFLWEEIPEDDVTEDDSAA